MSGNAEKCSDDNNFEASYTVQTQKWVKQSIREAQRRLRADVVAWRDQVKLACGSTVAITAFELGGFDAALADFSQRLRTLSMSDTTSMRR